MTDETRKEAHRLKSERGDLERRRIEIQHRINQIDARLLAIKWADHPIGSKASDKKGAEYLVGGFDNFWMLGYKIKKDGKPGSRLVAFDVKEPIELSPDRDQLETPE